MNKFRMGKDATARGGRASRDVLKLGLHSPISARCGRLRPQFGRTGPTAPPNVRRLPTACVGRVWGVGSGASNLAASQGWDLDESRCRQDSAPRRQTGGGVPRVVENVRKKSLPENSRTVARHAFPEVIPRDTSELRSGPTCGRRVGQQLWSRCSGSRGSVQIQPTWADVANFGQHVAGVDQTCLVGDRSWPTLAQLRPS